MSLKLRKHPLHLAAPPILVQQLQELLNHANNYVLALTLISALVWASQMHSGNANALGIWCIAVQFVTGAAFVHAGYWRLRVKPHQAYRVARQLIVLSSLEGLLWGALPLLAMDSTSLTTSVLIVSVIAAIMGGAPPLLSAVLPVYVGFATPVALGMALAFWMARNAAFDYLAIAALIYFLTMLVGARTSAQSIRTSIDLRLQLGNSLEKLRESEAFLKEAQEMASLGNYVLDIASGRWQGSEAIFQMYGIAKDYEPTLAALARLDHPEDLHVMPTYIQQTIATKSPIFDISYRIIRPDNQQTRWLRALGRMSFDELGQPIKLFGTLQDITEHRQREAALHESNQRLRAIEQRQTLSQERQRLMQDMHDGLGSSLVSALRVVECGKGSELDVAQVLKSCIDDLKLAIDSMETVEPDLLLLLATFRFRLGPRLESTGIALRWEVNDVPALIWLDPKNALHILRILQETFTNIIKHAHATEIRVATRVEGKRVLVSVLDNGQGFDWLAARQHSGRGLSNQVRRAEAIGAEVAWQANHSGTHFLMYLPIQQTTN